MLKLLADENFNNDLVRALLLRCPACDLVRVQDVGLESVDDEGVLAWAAESGRIVLTHDRATMPAAAFRRVVAGEPMPGLVLANDRLPAGQVVDELVLMVTCSEASDWDGRVLYLPL
jgi:predicted nuclease of predicted toxin-antitoxin system